MKDKQKKSDLETNCKKGKTSRNCFLFAVLFLVIGMALHVFRMHPEQHVRYQIGIVGGIIAMVICAIFFIMGLVETKRK